MLAIYPQCMFMMCVSYAAATRKSSTQNLYPTVKVVLQLWPDFKARVLNIRLKKYFLIQDERFVNNQNEDL